MTSCDCRVDIWAKEQKRRRKDQPASFWEQKAAAEKSLFRDPEFYKRLAEAALTAERVLLYTTGFQFDVYTGFSAVLAFRKALGEHPDPIVSDLFNETMIQVTCVANLSWSNLRSRSLCSLSQNSSSVGQLHAAGLPEPNVMSFLSHAASTSLRMSHARISRSLTDRLGTEEVPLQHAGGVEPCGRVLPEHPPVPGVRS